MVYDNRHRTFLQAIMHGGAVLDQDATNMCQKIFQQTSDVSTVTGLINDKLAPLAMCMKSGICEMTGNKYWSVVGTVHEENLIIENEYTPAQKAFLRVIFSEIIGSQEKCIQNTDCLNLVHTFGHKMNMAEAESFLRRVVKQKWLHCKDGYYYMGVRSIIELMPYFRATYQDHFLNCDLCKEVVFNGQKCDHCPFAAHNYCLARYVSLNKTDKCLNCKKELDISNLPTECQFPQRSAPENGDDLMEVCEDNDNPSQKSKSRKSKKRSRAI
ncbi:hypothetical protein QAD02_014261 [Eretmocerus hayati]|uniref:Uncharacterized protein n=1 Tax=Eretmocerus hayati TaxID=131215 RepID=A0ACC2P4E5_9HYME|nr:hypothetical protein QAD02_014261 [Eretmocerus hayati]